jgi:hypothetical protein
MAEDALAELARGLNVDGLYKLAVCGTAGYAAAASADAQWQAVCAYMKLLPGAYDRCWLDTFSRCLRQAAYRGTPPPAWVSLSRMACGPCTAEIRMFDCRANVVVWKAAAAMPWFTLTHEGSVYVYAAADGSRNAQPTQALLQAASALFGACVADSTEGSEEKIMLERTPLSRKVGELQLSY